MVDFDIKTLCTKMPYSKEVLTRCIYQENCSCDSLNYRESQKDFWDLFAVTETAEKKGIAQGREEERQIQERKRHEEKLAIARNLKNMGIPVEQIAQATGFIEQEIESL